MLTILGIDPGSRYTGFGIIQSHGDQYHYVHSGYLNVAKYDVQERLQKIFLGIQEIVQHYQPQEIAIEKVFVHKNVDGALKLGQARGAAMVASSLVGAALLPAAEYSARQIKQAVVGYGAASKIQITHMVKILLKLQQELASDEADALAVAICHAHVKNTQNKFGGKIALNFRRGRSR